MCDAEILRVQTGPGEQTWLDRCADTVSTCKLMKSHAHATRMDRGHEFALAQAAHMLSVHCTVPCMPYWAVQVVGLYRALLTARAALHNIKKVESDVSLLKEVKDFCKQRGEQAC